MIDVLLGAKSNLFVEIHALKIDPIATIRNAFAGGFMISGKGHIGGGILAAVLFACSFSVSPILATPTQTDPTASPTDDLATAVELVPKVDLKRCDESPGDDLSTQVASLPDGRLRLRFWVSHGVGANVLAPSIAAWYQGKELRVLYELVPTNRDPAPRGEVSWACLAFTRVELEFPVLPGPVTQIRLFESSARPVETRQIRSVDTGWSEHVVDDGI